ncbi:MAG: DNA primase [Cryomorphaceae bacterium]|nr:DNA primase [Cryomorphaceae bacterium]
MITQSTIDKIFETSRIEEVVADFVQLKRVGSNLRGLSPFTNEKTPSFYVSPAKQIYKCFSSGSGGNVVGFLMELEKMSYPEALRHLAERYGIEIEETERTDEQKEAISRRESLYLVNEFAAKHFVRQLHQSEEGVSIGLSYFKERGFSTETIKRFELGYSVKQSDALHQAAREKGFDPKILMELGLVLENDRGPYDRFRERVMFPIHNLSGRVAGFGGRTLRTDKKIAKYINSSESEIYNKSKLLYGLYQARKSIVKNDRCYLVEGYTDVISFSQAGVENTIATSGTSLTEEQVRQIKRLTENVVILFDGDAAGIKASMRGIDMFLREGLRVQTLLFPEGEDPDSYARSHSREELHDFLQKEVKDFLLFKVDFLLAEADGNPMMKAEAIREVVRTLSLMPSEVDRDVYVRESSRLLDTDENLLFSEVNRARSKQVEKEHASKKAAPAENISVIHKKTEETVHQAKKSTTYSQEAHLCKLLLNFGQTNCRFRLINEEGVLSKPAEEEESVASYIVNEIEADGLRFQEKLFFHIYEAYKTAVLEGEPLPEQKQFLRSEDQECVKIAIDLTEEKYRLSDWNAKGIFPKSEMDTLEQNVRESVLRFKEKMLHQLIEDSKAKLLESESDATTSEIMKELHQLMGLHKLIQKMVGQDV